MGGCMSGSHQLPLRQVSSGSALVRHDEAVSIIDDADPLPDRPSLQHIRPVDVGCPRPPVDEDHSVALACAPADGLPGLGNYLNAEGIESHAPLAPTGVALHLDTLARNKNIVAIEESIRILSDMVDGVAPLPKRTDHNTLNFLADLESALALLGVPI